MEVIDVDKELIFEKEVDFFRRNFKKLSFEDIFVYVFVFIIG